MNIIHFCADGIRNAECGIAAEKLAGNIIKEEHWKGEACAYRAMYAALNDVEAANSASDNTKRDAIILTLRKWRDGQGLYAIDDIIVDQLADKLAGVA